MPFQIIRNDITLMPCDAIVNTANPRPVVGAGTDAAIHAKAGPGLLQARQAIGPIRPGHSAITPGCQLPARYVIHTVGPVWRGGLFGEAGKLRSCYDSALELALQAKCASIAFPLISTGNYGFPKEKALAIAIDAFTAFLEDHEMEIFLVVFDRDSFRLSRKLYRGLTSYISEHYVTQATQREYGSPTGHGAPERYTRRETALPRNVPEAGDPRTAAPAAPKAEYIPRAAAPEFPPAASLSQLLQQLDAGFSETLLKLIDKSGKKDSEIYKKANLSKQHFSKIRNNPHYKPTKPTAIALAIALELDLAQTKDLIGRAGYALTHSSKFDLIIMYFIEQRNFNIMEINLALYQFDQSLLGEKSPLS